MKRSIRHLLARGLDRSVIRVAAADDVAVIVEGDEQVANAAVHLEDTRAGTDVERLGQVFSEGEAGLYLSNAVTLMTAVSMATDATFVPAGTRNGNEHWYSGFEPGSTKATDV